jgi:long-chain acyl-CoA synthetase
MRFEDAVAAVTAQGERFEIEPVAVEGTTYQVFKQAPDTLPTLFHRGFRRPDSTFLVYEDERWTFGTVRQHVNGMATALVERYGMAKGDRVAIAMRNYPEWVIAFAAITSVGAICVSLNAWWTAAELDFALEDSGATVLIADRERVQRATRSSQRLRITMIGVRLSRDPIPGSDRWEDAILLGHEPPDVAIHPDDDATILYTSGTDGPPKGAVSTHRALTQAVTAFACRAAVDRLRRPDAPRAKNPPAFILTVPLFHVTGCIPVMLSSFSAGMKIVIMFKWHPERALELIDREKVTTFVGVPTQFKDLLESPRFDDFDTSGLVSVTGGGAPIPPSLVNRVDTTFARARPGIGYGMTETNSYGPGNNGDDYVGHPTSAGRLLPIMELEIRNEIGARLSAGELGEIWFKGPNLIRGYWNRPEATRETLVDGWLRTGDLGRVDDDGFVYVVDRIKDIVLRGGENVYCAEVEAAIHSHEAVQDVAVFGVPDDRLGEAVAAAIVVRIGCSVTVGEIERHVAGRLAAMKVPSTIEFVSELPRNAAGKVIKRQLRQHTQSSTNAFGSPA